MAIDLGHAQFRIEGGERIVGDLRSCRGQCPQQRRLARVRRSDQTHVRDQLEVEQDLELVPFQSWLRVVGSVSSRALEMDIAPTAGAASRDHDARVGSVQVGDQRPVWVEREGSHGNFEDDVRAAAPCLPHPGAVCSGLGVPLPPLFV